MCSRSVWYVRDITSNEERGIHLEEGDIYG